MSNLRAVKISNTECEVCSNPAIFQILEGSVLVGKYCREHKSIIMSKED
jgi:hypothetical protein